ncbi:MAG: hypothetical protein ACREKE_10000 [bacterium]
MNDELLSETEWTVEGYLALFDPGSPDYALLKTRSEKLSRIVVRKVKATSGQTFEDTEFMEKSGVAYTVRMKL